MPSQHFSRPGTHNSRGGSSMHSRHEPPSRYYDEPHRDIGAAYPNAPTYRPSMSDARHSPSFPPGFAVPSSSSRDPSPSRLSTHSRSSLRSGAHHAHARQTGGRRVRFSLPSFPRFSNPFGSGSGSGSGSGFRGSPVERRDSWGSIDYE